MDYAANPEAKTPAEREVVYAQFVSLLARHDQAIRRFVRSLLPSSQGVDDVLQETALECWRKFSQFSPSCPADAAAEFIRWACVIARFKALSWHRDASRDRLVFREGVVECLAAAAMEGLEHQNLERQAFESCLGKLQDDQRRLLLSVYSPGQSIANIATETGEQARRLYGQVNVLRKRLLDCVRQTLASEVSHG
jgi:RNA polymerase sigma-70 factor (ECF subfamily)